MTTLTVLSMKARKAALAIIKSAIPMPIKQLPWRISWMRTTAAFATAPMLTTMRLFLWTFAECVKSSIAFDLNGFNLVTMPNNFCGLWVYVSRSYEPKLIGFLTRNLRPGQTFVDAGANIGIYSLHASKAVGPTGQVIAFEAHPRIARVLNDNVLRNRVTNISVVGAALGEKAGTMQMKYDRGNSGSTHIWTGVQSRQNATIEVTTLDSELLRRGLARVDYLKIDVEGFECAVLLGALNTIRQNAHIIIQTEIDERLLARYGKFPHDIFELLHSLEFQPYVVTESHELQSIVSAQYGDVIWKRCGPLV